MNIKFVVIFSKHNIAKIIFTQVALVEFISAFRFIIFVLSTDSCRFNTEFWVVVM